MRERQVGIQELQGNLIRFIDEVRSGIVLLVTDGGRRVARLVPEPDVDEPGDAPPIAWSGRRLKMSRPKARLRGDGSMADIVRENRR